jgi:hypothetical protein
MKKPAFFLSITTMFFMSGGSCADTQKQPPKEKPNPVPARTSSDGRKILVRFFSRTGNTREIARQIQEMTGGDGIVEKTRAAGN